MEPDEATVSPEQARASAYLQNLIRQIEAMSDNNLARELITLGEALDTEATILINELIARYDRVRKR